jgi:hypothetical protein
MKKLDITRQILVLREEDELKKLMAEVDNELEENMSSLLEEVDFCLNKRAKDEQSNVVFFTPKHNPVTNLFAQTELLAASGLSLADWFSQPINFSGVGFVLDIRRVIGTEDEIDLYLSAIDGEKMSSSLDAYKGKSVNLTITNNGKNLLLAELYVDDSGQEAEGSGVLNKLDKESIVKGELSIGIEVVE